MDANGTYRNLSDTLRQFDNVNVASRMAAVEIFPWGKNSHHLNSPPWSFILLMKEFLEELIWKTSNKQAHKYIYIYTNDIR